MVWYRYGQVRGNPKKKRKLRMTPTWFEHATFWSGVRRATVAPRSPCEIVKIFMWLFAEAGKKAYALSPWMKTSTSKHKLFNLWDTLVTRVSAHISLEGWVLMWPVIDFLNRQMPHMSKQSGAVEACWAHNPEVRGSKPRSANIFFKPVWFTTVDCVASQLTIRSENLW